jgi:hypothetical protein
VSAALDPRRVLGAGVVVTAIGLAVTGTAPVTGTPGSTRTPVQQDVGGGVVVLGWALLAWGVHAFGRQRDEGGSPSKGRDADE